MSDHIQNPVDFDLMVPIKFLKIQFQTVCYLGKVLVYRQHFTFGFVGEHFPQSYCIGLVSKMVK